jgi:hypothetical protein
MWTNHREPRGTVDLAKFGWVKFCSTSEGIEPTTSGHANDLTTKEPPPPQHMLLDMNMGKFCFELEVARISG